MNVRTWKMLRKIRRKLEGIEMKQEELAGELTKVKDQLGKIGSETQKLLVKIDDLTAAIAAASNTTPEVDAALAALKQQAQVVDDLVPDAPAA